jgi:hypothetical protein
MARVWLSAAAYYADLEPGYFQVPPGGALAESFEAALGTGGEDAALDRLPEAAALSIYRSDRSTYCIMPPCR